MQKPFHPFSAFITFEGIDGAGKSTHIPAVAEAIRQRGFPVVLTREPGGTALAERIRGMMLESPMDPLTETLLAFAARRDHIRNIITPALMDGAVVLCDRFTDSTVAYQQYGRGFERAGQVVSALERWVQSVATPDHSEVTLQPDLTLWYDLEPSIAAARLAGARTPDRFESQSEAFFKRVREGYSARRAAQPHRFARVEANQTPECVLDNVLASVNTFLDIHQRHIAAQQPDHRTRVVEMAGS
jgi:dTMP kinase